MNWFPVFSHPLTGASELNEQVKAITPVLSADLVEGDDGYSVHVDLPGVDLNDLNVTVQHGVLTIKAERKAVHEDKSGTHKIERSYGKVQRSLSLPPNAAEDSADAAFVNGVLTIKFAKKAIENTQGKLKIRTA